MNIDPRELQQLSAVQPRLDLYAGIHKALRAFMADTLVALGRVDVEDASAVDRVTAQVVEQLDLCARHVDHENEFVHAAIEARAPGASEAIAHEHDEHQREIARLRAAAVALREAARQVPPAACHALYGELAVFVGENLLHMQVEESAHNAVLWARYADAELAQLHDALVGSIPPAEMALVARWLVPSMNHMERVGMLSDARSKMPPPAFEALLDVAVPHLHAAEWSKLARALGVPPVRGLVEA
ncbi:MAG: hypothetical protein EOO24_26630 [Comamonadaceae bacterium]|nr:MAG: hypothetical protein EOO24_26630 [Comamonadaceae bacterium]